MEKGVNILKPVGPIASAINKTSVEGFSFSIDNNYQNNVFSLLMRSITEIQL